MNCHVYIIQLKNRYSTRFIETVKPSSIGKHSNDIYMQSIHVLHISCSVLSPYNELTFGFKLK